MEEKKKADFKHRSQVNYFVSYASPSTAQNTHENVFIPHICKYTERATFLGQRTYFGRGVTSEQPTHNPNWQKMSCFDLPGRIPHASSHNRFGNGNAESSILSFYPKSLECRSTRQKYENEGHTGFLFTPMPKHHCARTVDQS